MWSGRLRKNHSIARPACLGFFDCETRPTAPSGPGRHTHQLYLGVLTVGRLSQRSQETRLTHKQTVVFTSIPDFWRLLVQLIRPGRPTWLFAHNLAFDATIVGLWEQLRSQSWRLVMPGENRKPPPGVQPRDGLLVINDPPTAIAVRNSEDTTLLLLDSLNYFRAPLSQLGADCGLDKLPMPAPGASFSAWETYCRRDVEILERTMTRLLSWWSDNDLGKFRITTPALAMSAFRHRFMAHPIDFDDDARVRQLERHAYYGGQLEAFFIGKIRQPITHLDVNSLFPSVMLTGNFPCRLLASDTTRPMQPGKPPCEPHQSIAQVELDCGHETFPCRTSYGVFYAGGHGVTTLAGPELEYAWHKGYIKQWGPWAQYVCRPIFTDFVRFFWDLKERYEREGNATYRAFCKMLLNSLYGKFGARAGLWQIDRTMPPTYQFEQIIGCRLAGGDPIRWLCLYDQMLRYVPDQEMSNSFPAISAFVCAHSRQTMRVYRTIAGDRHVFYQATDSLLVDDTGAARLAQHGTIGDARLGALRFVSQYKKGAILGLHHYILDNHVVNGARSSTARDIDEDSWEQLQFDHLESVISRGGPSTIQITPVIKTSKKEYDKAFVGADGWTIPFDMQLLPGDPERL